MVNSLKVMWPSVSIQICVSRIGRKPESSGSSSSNLIVGCFELRCVRIFWGFTGVAYYCANMRHTHTRQMQS